MQVWLKGRNTVSKGERLPAVVLACLLFLTVTPAAAKEWTPVTGKDALCQLMSGLQAERPLPGGEVHRGEYLNIAPVVKNGLASLFGLGGK